MNAELKYLWLEPRLIYPSQCLKVMNLGVLKVILSTMATPLLIPDSVIHINHKANQCPLPSPPKPKSSPISSPNFVSRRKQPTPLGITTNPRTIGNEVRVSSP